MLFSSCDSLTGTCMGCMHHTAGVRCEVCAPGFYGDAVAAKNCTREWDQQQALGEEEQTDQGHVKSFSEVVQPSLGCALPG